MAMTLEELKAWLDTVNQTKGSDFKEAALNYPNELSDSATEFKPYDNKPLSFGEPTSYENISNLEHNLGSSKTANQSSNFGKYAETELKQTLKNDTYLNDLQNKFKTREGVLDRINKAYDESKLIKNPANATYIDDLKDMLIRAKLGTSSKIAEGTEAASNAASSLSPRILKAMEYVKGLPSSKLGRTVSAAAPTIGTGLGVLGTAIDAKQTMQDLDEGDTESAKLGGVKTALNAASMYNPQIALLSLAEQAGEYMPIIAGGDKYTQSERDRLNFANNKRMQEEREKGINVTPPVNAPMQSGQNVESTQLTDNNTSDDYATPMADTYSLTKPFPFKPKPSPFKTPNDLSEDNAMSETSDNYDNQYPMNSIQPIDLDAPVEHTGMSRSPSSMSSLNQPSKSDMISYTIQSAKEHGIDPSLALAQIEHESPGFRLNQVSKTGAKGLGQMFPKAFEEAKQMDISRKLGNLSYNDMTNPENWKQQIDASMLYNKAISKRYNKSGSIDEQLQRYVGGPSETLEQISKRGTDPVKYIKEIKAGQEKWKSILGDENEKLPEGVNRSPAFSDTTDVNKLSELSVQSPDSTNEMGEKEKSLAQSETASSAIQRAKEAMDNATKERADKEATVKEQNLKDLQDKLNVLRPTAQPLYTPKEFNGGGSSGGGGASGDFTDKDLEQKRLDVALQSDNSIQKQLQQAISDKNTNLTQAGILAGLGQAVTGLAGGIGKGGNVSVKNEGAPLFENLTKVSGTPLEDFKMKYAMMKEDPNSPEGRMLTGILKQQMEKLGLKGDPSNLTPDRAEKLLEHFSKEADRKLLQERHLAEYSEKKAGILDENTVKRFDTVGKLLNAELTNSRSTFGTHARTLATSRNIKALFDGVKSLDDLQSSEVYEVAKGLDRILSQGNPTVRSTDKLTPETARSWLGSTWAKITNERTGAGAKSFLEKTAFNLENEEATAINQIKKIQQRILAPYSDLKEKDPAKWQLTMALNGFGVDPFEDIGPAKTKTMKSADGLEEMKLNGKRYLVDHNTKKIIREL